MATGAWLMAAGYATVAHWAATRSFFVGADLVFGMSLLSMWIYLPGWLMLFADSAGAAGIRVPASPSRLPPRWLLGSSFLLAWGGGIGILSADSGLLGFGFIFLLAAPFLFPYLAFVYVPILLAHAWLFLSWQNGLADPAAQVRGWVGSIWLAAVAMIGAAIWVLLPIGAGIEFDLGASGGNGIDSTRVAFRALVMGLMAGAYTLLALAWRGRAPPRERMQSSFVPPRMSRLAHEDGVEAGLKRHVHNLPVILRRT